MRLDVMLLISMMGFSPRADQLSERERLFQKYRTESWETGVEQEHGAADKDIWIYRLERKDEETAAEFLARVRVAAGGRTSFAGHFAIVSLGCGSGCRQLAFVDAKSGTVTIAPFLVTTCRVAKGVPIDYRLRSRLLVVEGNVEWLPSAGKKPTIWECGLYYFRWTGKQLAPVVR